GSRAEPDWPLDRATPRWRDRSVESGWPFGFLGVLVTEEPSSPSEGDYPMSRVRALILLLVSLFTLADRTATAQGYPPAEAAKRMSVADGLEVRLFAAEPMVRQPVAIEFDDRGRLWVIQYLQYPNPAGLKRVSVDRYSRTAYDRVPEPPPCGPQGADRITILED